MDGSSLSVIVIPIVVTISLALWLVIVFYAVGHPLWEPRRAARTRHAARVSPAAQAGARMTLTAAVEFMLMLTERQATAAPQQTGAAAEASELTERERLPAVYPTNISAHDGGLISYAPDSARA